MCGRYTLKVDTKQVAQRFHVPPANISGEVQPSYNVAPSQLAPVITLKDGDTQLELMQWGLVPSWSKEGKTNYSTINARVETLTTSSAYRKPLRRQRCLVPASGFYEWQAAAGSSRATKQPFYFQLDENGEAGELFAFAGLYDIWHGDNGEKLKTYTIITTAANDLVLPVHQRMPVILPRDLEQRWLDPNLSESDDLLKLLQPFDPQLMTAFPVSKAVNTPANNGQELIAPLA